MSELDLMSLEKFVQRRLEGSWTKARKHFGFSKKDWEWIKHSHKIHHVLEEINGESKKYKLLNIKIVKEV